MKVVIPVIDTDSTVTRLVAKSTITQLLFSSEIDYIKDIIYTQRNNVAPQSQFYNEDEPVKLDGGDYIRVEYSESDDPDIYDINKYQNEYPYIFLNRALGISIAPMYSRKHLELSLTYESKSYGVLTTWLNAFNRRLLNSNAMDMHNITYEYSVPNEALIYLSQTHTAQENVAGYGMTLRDFLLNSFTTEGLAVRQNLDGNKSAITIYVKNTNCLGLYTQLPGVQETSIDPPASKLTFTYVLTYERITGVNLNFQTYIHNQVIDLTILQRFFDRRQHLAAPYGVPTASESLQAVTQRGYGPTSWPSTDSQINDGWRPTLVPRYSITDIIAPIQLDSTNLIGVLNTNLLTYYNYPTWLITLMGQYNTLVTNLYAWPIYFELFEVNTYTSNIPIQLNPDLNLVSADISITNLVLNNTYVVTNLGTNINWLSIGIPSTVTPAIGTVFTYNGTAITGNGDAVVKLQLDLRSRYYLRVSRITNLFNVDFRALQSQPALLLELLQFINPNVTLTTIGNGTYVTSDSLATALKLINNSEHEILSPKTIQQASIRATRNI